MTYRVTPPVHPGEVLREEFLVPLKLTPYGLAKRLNIVRTRIERLAREETSVTPDTALRLAKAFGTTPEFWLNLQAAYDITVAEVAHGDELAAIRPIENMGNGELERV
jgi:addiction module antidote protein, HigA family